MTFSPWLSSFPTNRDKSSMQVKSNKENAPKVLKNPDYSLSFYAGRISHFLRSIRSYKKLTQTGIAKHLKVSVSTISRAESEKLDSIDLDLLLGLASLAEMRLPNFILYLEKCDTKDGDLSPWQRQILESFAELKTITRTRFIKNVLIGLPSEKRDLLLDLVVDLAQLNDPLLESLCQFLKNINNWKEKD